MTFEEDDVYDQADADGFIKLNALRLRIRTQLEQARAVGAAAADVDDAAPVPGVG